MTQKLSLNLLFNKSIIKSLTFSPIREIYLDFRFPAEILTDKTPTSSKLIRFHNDEFYICISKYFDGKINLNNNLNSIEKIKMSGISIDFNNDILIPINKIDNLKICIGDFDLNFSTGNEIFVNKNKNNLSEIFPHLSLISLSVVLIIILFFSISPNANSFNLNGFESNNSFANAIIKPDQEKEKDLSSLKNDIKNDQGGKGKKHKFDEGKMGKKESNNITGQYAIKGNLNNNDITLAREKAIQTVLDTSVIQYLNSGGKNGSPFQSVFADRANGNNPEDILGGLYGNKIVEANGYDGLGLKGTGIGAGGDGEGTIGLGNDNTVGKGGGGGNGSGYGKGAGNLGGRKASAPDPMSGGTAEIRGSLDKDIIRRVIRRNINQIKFCYDSELQKDPTLAGRVRIKFVIDQNGGVASSSPIGIGVSNIVDSCVASKIKQLSFPTPEGGGIVEVTYPFIFQSAGEQ